MADPFDPGSTDPFSHSPGEVIGRTKVLQIDPAAAGFHARGPALPRARSPEISERVGPTLEQPAGLEQHMIGQRLPATEKSRARQPQPRLVDIETMRATPAARGKPPFLERAVDLFRDYPGTPPPWPMNLVPPGIPHSQADQSTKLAGDVVPLNPPTYAQETPEQKAKHKTSETLMRALGGSQNVLPIKPGDK